jgi:hypothetical protein
MTIQALITSRTPRSSGTADVRIPSFHVNFVGVLAMRYFVAWVHLSTGGDLTVRLKHQASSSSFVYCTITFWGNLISNPVWFYREQTLGAKTNTAPTPQDGDSQIIKYV